MNHLDLLTFARGSALNWALIIFAAGVVLRLFEIFGLGRKADLAKPRLNSPGSGWRTIFTRSLPPEGMLKRDPVTYIGGYVFHFGLFIAMFFFAPHIEFFRSMTGLSWASLPNAMVDASVVAAIRPDDVVVGGDAAVPNAFRAKVDIVEYLGREDEVIVTLKTGGRLWVRTAVRVTLGENVTVVLPPERVIFLPSEESGGTE